jgi:hypothetical protein
MSAGAHLEVHHWHATSVVFLELGVKGGMDFSWVRVYAGWAQAA